MTAIASAYAPAVKLNAAHLLAKTADEPLNAESIRTLFLRDCNRPTKRKAREWLRENGRIVAMFSVAKPA